MSSAYSTINRSHSGLHNAATSSRYMANKKGENTEPCHTPNSIINSVDQEFPHLVQAKQPENRFSIICIISTGMFLLISFIKTA